jgi:transcriptional regulator with XRE-family HTH domain
MDEKWIGRQSATPEARRLYEQERLVAWATERLSEAMEEGEVSKADLARLLETSRANVTALLSGGRNMTLRTLADVACVLGHRVEISLEPLRQGQFLSAPLRVVRPLRAQIVEEPTLELDQQTTLPLPSVDAGRSGRELPEDTLAA